jgi:alpha/beta superfamily hydrolase
MKATNGKFNLLTFDFSGCGNSKGEYVTLGWKEVEDLHAVLLWLKEQGKTNKVLLWGRSMGAATAILYEKQVEGIEVAGLVLDSAFANFKDVARSTVAQFGMPEQMIEMVWP